AQHRRPGASTRRNPRKNHCPDLGGQDADEDTEGLERERGPRWTPERRPEEVRGGGHPGSRSSERTEAQGVPEVVREGSAPSRGRNQTRSLGSGALTAGTDDDSNPDRARAL